MSEENVINQNNSLINLKKSEPISSYSIRETEKLFSTKSPHFKTNTIKGKFFEDDKTKVTNKEEKLASKFMTNFLKIIWNLLCLLYTNQKDQIDSKNLTDSFENFKLTIQKKFIRKFFYPFLSLNSSKDDSNVEIFQSVFYK